MQNNQEFLISNTIVAVTFSVAFLKF